MAGTDGFLGDYTENCGEKELISVCDDHRKFMVQCSHGSRGSSGSPHSPSSDGLGEGGSSGSTPTTLDFNLLLTMIWYACKLATLSTVAKPSLKNTTYSLYFRLQVKEKFYAAVIVGFFNAFALHF